MLPELSLSDSRCLSPGQMLSQILQLTRGQSSATKRPSHRKSSSIFVLFIYFFLLVLLRYNGHTALHKFKVCSLWFESVHHEMILTVSVVNIHSLIQIQKKKKNVFFMVRILRICYLVVQLLSDLMNYSTPGFSVLHSSLELVHILIHWVGAAS